MYDQNLAVRTKPDVGRDGEFSKQDIIYVSRYSKSRVLWLTVYQTQSMSYEHWCKYFCVHGWSKAIVYLHSVGQIGMD